ncbi:acyl-CoA N-acyltransferases (NAT) superfamily protein [Actinidia rufa]|uniref:Acyl-CoA N-acyltransferases (NAT) superfamily protein n=1 Tax=Actinidia rufa TaxID=165716 RepID=A0A7J0DW84_9ERIC|nr:acyl-CoA N-acyltransferases (NAT) superfamily protein [Actinidia rufa]
MYLHRNGQEGRKECEKYSTEECSGNPRFEHQERVKFPLFCSIDRPGQSRYGYIANLCVAKSARRQGIASNMLHFAVNLAKSNGIEEVFVRVYRNNKPAQKLYEKMGFKVVEMATRQLSKEQTYLLCYKINSHST